MVIIFWTIVIALFAEDSSVKEHLLNIEQVFVPSIVLGELYYGAYKSSHIEENIALIDEFANTNSVLGTNSNTAQEYGNIKNSLKNKGRPIPENDIWIASIAKQYKLILVTRDGHFKEIEGIVIEIW